MSAGRALIGIAGPSCSGKTLLAEALRASLPLLNPAVLSLDSYYLDLSDLELEQRAMRNFDVPMALDFALIEKDLRALALGVRVLVPSYRFDLHERAPESEWRPCPPEEGPESKLIIVEGLFTFHFPRVTEIFDKKVYVDADHGVCLERRLIRDSAERGRTKESIREQYELTVRPMAERFIIPQKRLADLVLDGTASVDESVRRVLRLVCRS